MEGISSQKKWSADELKAGLANGSIDAEELKRKANAQYEKYKLQIKPTCIQPLSEEEKKQVMEAAEKLKIRTSLNNGDVLVRRAPIQPLNPQEREVLETAIKKLKPMIKK